MKVKIRIRKPHPALLAAIGVLLVLCIGTTALVNAVTAGIEAEITQLRGEAHAEETLKDRLIRNIAELGTIPGVLQVAREELGLVPPDAVIFETKPVN